MNLKRNSETIKTTIVYDTRIWKSTNSSRVGTPSDASFVALISVMSRGRRTGKDKTGYRVPLEFAFAIIAAIIVDDTTMPKFPSTTVIKNAGKLRILMPVIKVNRKKITIFRENVSTKLNKSLPANISEGEAESFNARDVPVSSSLMKTLDKPLIAVKNMTIQNNPDNIASSTTSSPRENLIMEIVIITNISSELITYLFLISERMSFLKTEYVYLSISIILHLQFKENPGLKPMKKQ
jgi:hypothetical protein